MRFVLELALVGLYAWFGFRLGGRIAPFADWLFGLGLPLVLVITWATYVAPRASDRLRDPTRLVLELVLFGVGAAMLVATGRAVWGVALFAGFVSDRVLLDRLGTPAWAEPTGQRAD